MTPNRPTTDIHEIVNKEVCNHMKPFIQANMEEHEQTRSQLSRLENAVRKITSLNAHDVIQYTAILITLTLSLIGLTSC